MRFFSENTPKILPRHGFQATSVALVMALALIGGTLGAAPVAAQTGPAVADPAPKAAKATRKPKPASKPKPNPYGSPLDTLMSTHLWADVPPAEPFVKETRPDPESLHYTPLTGADPTRPKPRDAAGIAALQAELEAGRLTNEARAKGLQPPTKAARRSRKKDADAASADAR